MREGTGVSGGAGALYGTGVPDGDGGGTGGGGGGVGGGGRGDSGSGRSGEGRERNVEQRPVERGTTVSEAGQCVEGNPNTAMSWNRREFGV